jgi:AraC-like DNA-binding protein
LKIDDQFYNISWLKLFIVIDLTIMICTFPVLIAFPNETNTSLLAQLIMDVQLVYIFVRTFWENGLFSNLPIEGAEIVEDKSSISTLKISDEISQEYVLMIKVYMENEKPFLKEDCTMQLVSEGVGIPMHQLSYVLNKCCKKNFSDFVNEYRIDLSRHLLQSISYERMTIEAIGFECGFGSKSNFNKAFKKITNMTPSEYRNRMQNA